MSDKVPTPGSAKADVVGLYSFPKSGNTWLRAIIAAITGIPNGPGMMQKYVTDSHYGPVIENPWEFQGREWYFYKSHHKNLLTDHEGQRFDTDKVVYIYRHPLDVFLSYLNFVSRNVSPNAGKSLPVEFDKVEDLTPKEMEALFRIFLDNATLFPKNKSFGGVFEHVGLARARARDNGNVHLMRYEDLMDDFDTQVQKLCGFLDFKDVNIEEVFKAADGRTKQNGKFFWKRQKENYRNYLTDEQIDRFAKRHGEKMAALGYSV